MGLDQWIIAKTKLELNNEATGVCSGLFPITLVEKDEYELGYLRKAYDQEEVILNHVDQKIDDDVYTFNEFGIRSILYEAQHILSTHVFNEEGEDIDTEFTTWNSKQKWETTIDAFTKALNIIHKDPEAQIIYKEWY